MRRTNAVPAAAAAVWLLLLGLVLAYREPLRWAVRALPAELRRDGFPAHPQWELYEQAVAEWEATRDPRRTAELLERSLAIEPNADPLRLLGDVRLAEGDDEGALVLFLRAVDHDPSDLAAYLRASDVLRRLGWADERLAVLRRGRDHFARQVERAVPRSDPTVAPAYNAKAARVYEDHLRGERILRSHVALLEAGQEPFVAE